METVDPCASTPDERQVDEAMGQCPEGCAWTSDDDHDSLLALDVTDIAAVMVVMADKLAWTFDDGRRTVPPFDFKAFVSYHNWPRGAAGLLWLGEILEGIHEERRAAGEDRALLRAMSTLALSGDAA